MLPGKLFCRLSGRGTGFLCTTLNSISATRKRNFASNIRQTTSYWKYGVIGAFCGMTVGGFYSFYTARSQNINSPLTEETLLVLDKLPAVKVTKSLPVGKNGSDLGLILFQFQSCPFCCKVRTLLDFYGIPYSLVEVDPVLRQQLRWTDYKKVPILLAKRKDGKYVQLTDSSTILSIIYSYLQDENKDVGNLAKLYPYASFVDENGVRKSEILNKYYVINEDFVSTPDNIKEIQDEMKWRAWVDSELVHLISPNVYRTRSEAKQTFEWFCEVGEWRTHFPSWECFLMIFVGSNAMWLVSKRLMKKYNLNGDVREPLFNALNLFTNELTTRNSKFLGGEQPNLADLSVFGVLTSMEGCTAFQECLKNTDIGKWFYRVKELVNKNRALAVCN